MEKFSIHIKYLLNISCNLIGILCKNTENKTANKKTKTNKIYFKEKNINEEEEESEKVDS